MSAPEGREERYARIKAAEQAARDYRATLAPIDPNALKLAMGGASTYDEHGNPVCGRCERDEPVGLVFGVIIDGVSKLCKDCIESVGRRGEALAMLVEAVEDLDSAIAYASPEDRVELLGAAGVMVTQWVARARGLSGVVSVE
ncbi:hypothetical protein ABZ783_07165 [Micromonospora sp. NPDC047738]|uniref:hypothetical protein n=1 Tax=Micromonospora sp. NPDC047738 TaxID=3155741 RepID=UPI0034035E89